jgi:transcriptional regulator with XRE-family HTH domain
MMTISILNAVGAKIRDIRKQKGLSQEQLGEKASFHFSYIGGVERGEKNISLLNLEKIAEALDVQIYDLFSYGTMKLNGKDIELQNIIGSLLKLDQHELKKVRTIINEFFN